MRKRSGIRAPIFCVASLCFVGAAQAQGVVDQEQPLTRPSEATHAVGGGSEQKLAQTFTVGAEGSLTEIRLPIACSSGELIVEIQLLDRRGMPSGRTVTSGRVPASDIGPPLGEYRSIALDPPLDVLPGQQYAIVISNPTGTCGMLRGPERDSYSGGTGFFDARPNPPGWIGFKGGPGDPDQPHDLPFQTVVDTSTSAAAENRCVGMTAGGAVPLPFSRDLPVCGCLSDVVLNEWQCRFLHPDFFIVRRIPFPLQAGKKFKEEWAFTPLTKLDGPVRIEMTGAGLSKPIKYEFGKRSKIGGFEHFKVQGVAPEQGADLPGFVRFSYPMEDAQSEFAKEFGFDSTISGDQIK